jgi:hypothetical protein
MDALGAGSAFIPLFLLIALCVAVWLILLKKRPVAPEGENIRVRTYWGTRAKATALFQAVSTKMAAAGYLPTSQIWAQDGWSTADFIIAALLLCDHRLHHFPIHADHEAEQGHPHGNL